MTKAKNSGKKAATKKAKPAAKKPVSKKGMVDETPKEVEEAVEKKKTAPVKKALSKGIPYESITFDDKKKRPDVCLKIKGENYWFPRIEIKLNKNAKTVEMPEWLRELKLGK